VKPQILSVTTGTAGDVNDYVSAQINLPVSRFGGLKTKTVVFELLSVSWYIAITDILDTISVNAAWLSTVQSRVSGDTATIGSLADDVDNPLNFAFALENHNLVTTGGWTQVMPIQIDMTDGAGNGILIATDRLFITGGNVNGTSGARYVAKLKYRLSSVGIEEYVGIVQSQQG